MGLMIRVFQNYLESIVIVFIENILVYLENQNGHMNYLWVVLKVLKEHQLFARYSKSEFWLRSIVFLGHIILCKGIEVDPKKMEQVRFQPRLLTPIDTRCFFGLAGYYKTFVKGFASIASPLTKLTQKKVKYEWSEPCKRSFQELKNMLNFATVLTLREGTKHFVVYLDASRVGLGCILMQHNKVISYTSEQLKVHEKNYQTCEFKLGAIVLSLKIWRHYLQGIYVDVFTDHKCLEYVFTEIAFHTIKMVGNIEGL